MPDRQGKIRHPQLVGQSIELIFDVFRQREVFEPVSSKRNEVLQVFPAIIVRVVRQWCVAAGIGLSCLAGVSEHPDLHRVFVFKRWILRR